MDGDILIARSSGVYINDQLFVMLGFYTGTSSIFQRNLAYGIAEEQMARHLGTFISPTTVTGTYPFVSPNHVLELFIGQLIRVNSVTLYERISDTVDRLISGTAIVLSPRFGYVKIDVSPYDNSACVGCPGTVQISSRGIYKAEISYTAGYATGQLMDDPAFRAALGMAADIVVKQLSDEGLAAEMEGGPVQTMQVGR
jgi:hypothetical protein